MMIGSDVSLESALIAELIRCGHAAHQIAQAHHNDPGANGFTFGTDRYQRATELAVDPLLAHGFEVSRRGAGRIARRDGVELHFAVARGTDLTDPGNFDADSSPARRRAGEQNSGQMALDGMPQAPAAPIVHVVWSGTPDDGLTAVHAGRLVMGASDRLDWAVLVRLDALDPEQLSDIDATPGLPPYTEQPQPLLELSAKARSSLTDEA